LADFTSTKLIFGHRTSWFDGLLTFEDGARLKARADVGHEDLFEIATRTKFVADLRLGVL
jgi:hypothetical protein